MKRIGRIAVMVFVLLLCGCGRGGKAVPKQEETVIVTVWTKDRHDAVFQEEKITEYNRTNKDHIKVEYKIFSDNYYQAMNTAFQSNHAPDLMAYTPEVFGAFFSKNYFADINPYMDEEFRQIFGSARFEGINAIGDRCYFLPTGASTSRLYYNKDIFRRVGIQRPPETMEELIADARMITEKLSGEGIYGFAANMKTSKAGIERSILRQGNRELGLEAGYDFQRGCYDFTAYQPLIEGWRELLSEDCAYPNCRELDIDPLRQMFSQGKIGMYMSYTHSEEGIYSHQFPMEAEWGCARLPVTAGVVKGSQNYTLSNGYLFNAQSEHLEEAWKVYRAVFTDLQYLKEYQMNGLGCSIIPWIIQMAKESGYEPKEESLLLLEDDQMWPRTPQELNSDAVNIKGLDWYDTMKKLIFSDADIKESLQDLTERYNEAYRKGISNNIGREVKNENFDPLKP
ncbi:MAG: extracellular solute-binding protein [Lachnospiraceae bacterium]|nr:extracellular solute-binding protein [Lachnospiraceae bacterium]